MGLYEWLGIGYLVCVLISLVYLLLYAFVIYPKTLNRKVRLDDIYIWRLLFAILIQPFGLLIIIVDTIVEYFKKRSKKKWQSY